MKLLTKDKKESTELMIKEFYLAPFKYYLDNNYLNSICNHYVKEFNYMKKNIDYYKKQWFRYFKKGMLDYSNITKNQRSNSYIENYYRLIKLKLSKFLYVRSKCKISWPLFLYFIKNEE